LLTEQGGVPDVAKVLDFGLVKQLVRPTDEAPGTPVLTQDNAISGTPTYMAPEAIVTPDLIDARTDLYALGAVGYFLLTGQDVFTGHNIVEICGHHLHSTPPPPSERIDAPIPSDLEQLILTCLQKSPDARVPDARTLQTRLRACQDAQRWSEEDARRWFVEHGPALRAKKPRSSVSGSATLAVDLGLRLAEAEWAERGAE
jgi:serine/threonine-protein kinase